MRAFDALLVSAGLGLERRGERLLRGSDSGPPPDAGRMVGEPASVLLFPEIDSVRVVLSLPWWGDIVV